MAKRHLLLVGFLIIIVAFAGITVYIFTSGMLAPMPSGPGRHYFYFDVRNLSFVDGGLGNDTIIATAINTSSQTLTITDGQAAQRNWVQYGRIGKNDHPFATKLIGDITIPANSTKDIHLSLPRDTLVAGKEYSVTLRATSQAFNSTMGYSQRYIFYHMYHPFASSPIEEGVIRDLSFSIIHLNYLDSILAEVQNTGDTAITVQGGFANGMAAINVTGDRPWLNPCVIEPSSTGRVSLNFKADSFMLAQSENNIPFNVKLITSTGNIIEYPDKVYIAWKGQMWAIEPEISEEHAQFSNVKFIAQSPENISISMAVKNTGGSELEVTGAMLNGKTLSTERLIHVIQIGDTKTITLPVIAEPPVQGSKYQLVLISFQNNAFVYTSTYS